MFASSSTKPLKPVWRAFDKLNKNDKVYGKCKYCSKKYVSHCDRMLKHILSCSKAPLALKESLAKNSNLKGKVVTDPDVNDFESENTNETSSKVNIHIFIFSYLKFTIFYKKNVYIIKKKIIG